jgi:hypothetical protein
MNKIIKVLSYNMQRTIGDQIEIADGTGAIVAIGRVEEAKPGGYLHGYRFQNLTVRVLVTDGIRPSKLDQEICLAEPA